MAGRDISALVELGALEGQCRLAAVFWAVGTAQGHCLLRAAVRRPAVGGSELHAALPVKAPPCHWQGASLPPIAPRASVAPQAAPSKGDVPSTQTLLLPTCREPSDKDKNDSRNREESNKIQGLALRIWGIPDGIQVEESPLPLGAPTHFTPVPGDRADSGRLPREASGLGFKGERGRIPAVFWRGWWGGPWVESRAPGTSSACGHRAWA